MNESRKGPDPLGIILGLLSSAAFGMIPLFSLPLIRAGVPTHTVLAYRFTIAAVVIAAFLKMRKERLAVSPGDLVKLGFLSAMYLMAVEFFYESFNFLPSGVTATIQFLYPVMVMLIMILFFHEHFHWQVGVAVVLAFSGVAALSLGPGLPQSQESDLNIFWGVCLSLLAGFTNGLYFIGLKVARVSHINGLIITFYVMLFGSLFCLGDALARNAFCLILDPWQITLAILLALVTAVFSNLTLVLAVQRIGPTLASILGVMEPVTAVTVGSCVFYEPFTWHIVLGMILIALAVGTVVLMPAKSS